ncbi:MAG: hypothetical protein IAG10_20420 [Planctomycetaceae bacterium]|nr:hypothetical protein [Planctomycetaceae bacterium]
MRLTAEFVAKAVGQDVQSRWLILEREAADADLATWLSAPFDATAGDRLQVWLSDRKAQNDNSIAHAHAWALFDRQGICRGRFPKGIGNADTIGKNFIYRDYFHGLGRDIDPKEPDFDAQQIQPIERPHRSNVFQSKADNLLVVNLSVPVWLAQAGERRVGGVLSMSLEIGDFRILKSNLQGRVLRLLDTNSSALKQRGTVLFDSRSESGMLASKSQHAPETLVKELEHLRLTRMQQLREQLPTEGLLKEDFLDDAESDSTHRWVAIFEPVILKTASGDLHDTGWVVVVQQPAEVRDKR